VPTLNKPVYRPFSVWIAQVGLVPPLVSLLIVMPIRFVQCFSAEQMQSCLSSDGISSFVAGFFTFALAAVTFWGLQKRRHYGKWLAVILLIGGAVTTAKKSDFLQLVYRSITQWQPLPTPPYECWKSSLLDGNTSQSCGYSSYSELEIGIALDLLTTLFLGYLAVSLLYSDAAKRFFH
jgi:hypothetical protein